MHKKLVVLTLAAGMLVSSGASMVQAQGGAGGGGGMGGGMRNRNNPKSRLSSLWRGVGQLESSKAPLSKAQARQIVALVRPWGSRPKMTEADAKNLYMKMNAVLTTRQKNELDKMVAMRRRTARGGGEDGGRPGGAGGNFDPQQMQKMRAQMQQMQGFLKTMNPFYPPSKYSEVKGLPDRMQQGFNRRYSSSHATLVALVRKAA
jgi:hypothetical protein